MEKEYHIFEVTEPKEEYAAAIRNLLPQLSSSQHTFTLDTLQSLTACEGTHLFLLQAEGCIVGMLTLCSALSPTGCKMWIEDVVVDEAFRGQGLSKLLVAHAIQFVESKQIPLLMLTSNPTRVAANKLYQAMGFGRKETNVYRMTF